VSLPAALLHRVHLAAGRGAHRRFRAALRDPETAQRSLLAETLDVLGGTRRWQDLRGLSWERFTATAPVITYQDLQGELEAQRRDGEPHVAPPCRRWQPTSGATDRRKWIPYPQPFLASLDEAAGAWLADLARSHPAAFAGPHYWSLSWLPEELRAETAGTDDRALLGFWKRVALAPVMAVPAAVAQLPDADSALLATVAYLAACQDLRLISVWSPTFALTLLSELSRRREELVQYLRQGRWPLALPAPRNRCAAQLLRSWDGHADPSFLLALWPRLALLSAWDSGSSAPYALALRELFPGVGFQGKGLWATEGVVTIPYRDRRPLALTAHVLELRCLASGRILPPWQLGEGQEVQPVLTTKAGLVRYLLPDRLQVDGFIERTPSLRFLDRLGGPDLVGEKLDRSAVRVLLAELEQRHGIQRATLWAVPEPAHYLLTGEAPAEVRAVLAEELENELARFHHYRLARELHQLGAARIHLVPDTVAFLGELARRSGRLQGEWKPETLAIWPLAEVPDGGSP
jgi:hypothetical protein